MDGGLQIQLPVIHTPRDSQATLHHDLLFLNERWSDPFCWRLDSPGGLRFEWMRGKSSDKSNCRREQQVNELEKRLSSLEVPACVS
jgi:hypothetical protein